MNLGKILISKRNALHYSQKQASDLLEVSQSTYCDWESGAVKPRAENLLKISKLYQVDLNDLIDSDSDFTIVNSPNSVNLNKSPNSKIETSDALIKVSQSLDKLIAIMEKLFTK